MDKVISLRQGGVATSGKVNEAIILEGKVQFLAQITLVGQSLVDMDALVNPVDDPVG